MAVQPYQYRGNLNPKARMWAQPTKTPVDRSKSQWHAVAGPSGGLRGPRSMDLGDNPYEAIKELYGMIWQLAGELERITNKPAKDSIETARVYYQDGLYLSPTKRFKGST